MTQLILENHSQFSTDNENHVFLFICYPPSPATPTRQAATAGGADVSCGTQEWASFCDRHGHLAADHFYKNICECLLTSSTPLEELVSARHVLNRYIATFSDKVHNT